MTLDEAKFILTTFRVGEFDPGESGVGEAVELAEKNPELAAWWEKEQAFDRAFARKLASLAPPPELIQTIMRGGATIFFARRLIAESTDDVAEETPPPDEEVSAEADVSDAVLASKQALAEEMLLAPEPAQPAAEPARARRRTVTARADSRWRHLSMWIAFLVVMFLIFLGVGFALGTWASFQFLLSRLFGGGG
jgi:hypothetical protein